MVNENEKTLEGLRVAVQMEIDGKEFYLKASRESGNEMGRKLLENLSIEEDLHRQKFEQIYEILQQKKSWPGIKLEPTRRQQLKTLFAQQAEELGTGITALTTELDAVDTAMDMENKSYDFYKARSRTATFAAEKDFYKAVAAEETEHHKLLRDYYEYLKDPVQWFQQKEHPLMDGA
ncbi:MAG: ferritin family protein [Dehalococcoidales bacterium]|nr:MAG: ferritin family protein [Dehalococcoidales bacterium]